MIFGHPFHGLVRNGVLTLPNGQTMPYPQPSEGGATVFRVPGAPAITRSEEEAAADAAAGRQWLDYAIISGTDRRLYGKALGQYSWLYSSGPGAVWLIQVLSLTGNGSAASVSLSVRPFGKLGEAPVAATTITASVSGAVYGTADMLCDTKEDGSAATFRITNGAGGHTAFVEVSCSLSQGNVEVAVAVLRQSQAGYSESITGALRRDELAAWPWLVYGETRYVMSAPRGTVRTVRTYVVAYWYVAGSPSQVSIVWDEAATYSDGQSVTIGLIGPDNALANFVKSDPGGATHAVSYSISARCGGATIGTASGGWSYAYAASPASAVVTAGSYFDFSPVGYGGSPISTTGTPEYLYAASAQPKCVVVATGPSPQMGVDKARYVLVAGLNNFVAPSTSFSEAYQRHHSAHPVTGELSVMNEVPVCWV